MIGLLFGLTIGLMNLLRMTEKTHVIADKQFVKQTDLWKSVFILTRICWQEIATMGMFFTWSQKQPEFLLCDEIIEVESHESYGIQLADYICYATRQFKLQNMQDTLHLSVLDRRNLVPFKPGIYVGLGNYEFPK